MIETADGQLKGPRLGCGQPGFLGELGIVFVAIVLLRRVDEMAVLVGEIGIVIADIACGDSLVISY